MERFGRNGQFGVLSRTGQFLHAVIFFSTAGLFKIRIKSWAKHESCRECSNDVIADIVCTISCRIFILMKMLRELYCVGQNGSNAELRCQCPVVSR